MALVCIHCGNHGQKQVYDQESKDYEVICMTCGRDKFEEAVTLEPINKEVTPMSHLLCEAPEGCKKIVVRDRLCTVHYRAKHGVSPRGVPSTKKPPLTGEEIQAHKICSVKGCGRKKLAEGVCYKHLTEKHGGVNPYKYPKKKNNKVDDVEKIVKLTPDEEVVIVQPLKNSPVLILNFDGHEDLHLALKRIAHEDFRTMEGEVLYLINWAVNLSEKEKQGTVSFLKEVSGESIF